MMADKNTQKSWKREKRRVP